MTRRLSFAALAAACVAAVAVTAAFAAAPKPTARDRADARAFIAAYGRTQRSAEAAMKGVPNPFASPATVCGGVLSGTVGSLNATAATTMLVDLFAVAGMQRIAPTLDRFGRDLEAVHAHDPVLAAYARYVSGELVPMFARYAAAPRIDVCVVLAAWKRSGFAAVFDWTRAAHLPTALAARVAHDIQALSTGTKLNGQVEARLVALGISRKAAHDFVS